VVQLEYLFKIVIPNAFAVQFEYFIPKLSFRTPFRREESAVCQAEAYASPIKPTLNDNAGERILPTCNHCYNQHNRAAHVPLC